MTEAQRDDKLDKIESAVADLVVVMKGYNGFKGLAQIVQDHTEGIQELQGVFLGLKTCVDPLPPAITGLSERIEELQVRPGNTALKWINRIGVAFLGAACLVLLTWIVSMKSITQVKIVEPLPSNPQTPSLMRNDP